MEEERQVLEKLEKEWNECTGVSGTYSAVAGPIYHVIRGFCKQDAEFASLVLSSSMTLKGCIEMVCKNIHSGISDYEVYAKAIGAYCPGARISMYMELDLTGGGESGVAFGRDGTVSEDVYGKTEIKMPKKDAKKAEKKSKILPPPDVSGHAKTETSAKVEKEKQEEEKTKIMRFNFMDLL